MWAKVIQFVGKYVIGYAIEALTNYIQYKLAEYKLKKKTKEQVNEIKKTSATKKEAAARMRDLLNN